MEVANECQGHKQHVPVEASYVFPSIFEHCLKRQFKQHHQLEPAYIINHGPIMGTPLLFFTCISRSPNLGLFLKEILTILSHLTYTHLRFIFIVFSEHHRPLYPSTHVVYRQSRLQ